MEMCSKSLIPLHLAKKHTWPHEYVQCVLSTHIHHGLYYFTKHLFVQSNRKSRLHLACGQLQVIVCVFFFPPLVQK